MGRSGIPRRQSLLCGVTAFALVAGLLLSPAWYSGAVTAQEAPADVAADTPPDAQPAALPAPPELLVPPEMPVVPETLVGPGMPVAAANSPVLAATCGGLTVGSVVRLATTPDEFVCAADGQMHWILGRQTSRSLRGYTWIVLMLCWFRKARWDDWSGKGCR